MLQILMKRKRKERREIGESVSDRIVPCTIIVYNKLSSSDKETFEKLVHANNINFATWQIKIIYVNNFEEAKKYL